jgi:hypothetical protein
MTAAAEAMLDAYPASRLQVRPDLLVRCVTACMQCPLACTAGSDACLVEDDLVDLDSSLQTHSPTPVVAGKGRVLVGHQSQESRGPVQRW